MATTSTVLLHSTRLTRRALAPCLLSSRRALSSSLTLYYASSSTRQNVASASPSSSSSKLVGNVTPVVPGTQRRASQMSEPAKVQDGKGGSIESPHFRDNKIPNVSEVVPVHEHAVEPLVPPMTGDWVLFHPVYTNKENHAVKVLTRTPQSMSDRVARLFCSTLRFGFDFVSRYKHKEIPAGHSMSLAELRAGGYIMTEQQWLARILFLESIAGVPGMVAAALRHLRSLRSMKRDNAWIHTLLQEAENERMHLMSFMTLKKPGPLFRAMILGAQGVFYNLFFAAYLVSPATSHRFIGCLEEEAVVTYSNLIKALEAGHLPEWENLPAPVIAIEYWRLPADAKLIDMVYAVRSDESTHRFVNHSLASLKPEDVNPFAMGEPSMGVKGTKVGFEREESIDYIRRGQDALAKAKEMASSQQSS